MAKNDFRKYGLEDIYPGGQYGQPDTGYWSPEIMSLLAPGPAAETPKKPGMKERLMEILPMLLAAGGGAALGGAQGFGSAMTTFANQRLAQQELEQRRTAAQEAAEARQTQAKLRALDNLLQRKQQAELAGLQRESTEKIAAGVQAGARERAEMTQAGETARQQAGFAEARRPVTISDIVSVATGKGGAVESRFAPAAITGALNLAAQKEAAGERKEAATTAFGREMEKLEAEQKFAQAQQGRQLGHATFMQGRQFAHDIEMLNSRIAKESEKAGFTGEQIDAIEGTAGGLMQLDQIEKQKDVLKKMIGPVAGRWAARKEELGLSSAEEATAHAVVQSYFNQLAKARSGGAVTPTEEARLKAELMTPNLNIDQFMARLKVQREFLQTKWNIRYKLATPAQRKALDSILSGGGASGSFDTGGGEANTYLKSIGFK